MVQGRRPKKEQDPEIVELLEELKAKLKMKTDRELAEFLNCKPALISRWKTDGFPEYVKRLIKLINQQNKIQISLIFISLPLETQRHSLGVRYKENGRW